MPSRKKKKKRSRTKPTANRPEAMAEVDKEAAARAEQQRTANDERKARAEALKEQKESLALAKQLERR